MIFTRFDDAAAAGREVAVQVAGALREGIARRGTGSLAVPGGRTPVAMFGALRGQELDWSSVDVTLTDERWVPETSPWSNAAMVRRELLQGRAGKARFHPLYDATPTAKAAQAAVWSALGALARPFDAVVLGMGEDGHFASLFAGNERLAPALDPAAVPACVAMVAVDEPRERLSLNLAALLQTHRLFVLATGDAKRDALLSAARGTPADTLPVAALLAQRQARVEVHWAP